MHNSQVPACHLVRDLLVPYMAGDVSPETRTWVDEHTAGCPDCRAAVAEMAAMAPPPPPSPSVETGRRLAWRVKRQVILLWAAVFFSLTLAAGGFIWGHGGFGRHQADILPHPVPSYAVAPERAARVNLAHLGLEHVAVEAVPDGALVRYTDASGQTAATLAFYRLSSPYRARVRYGEWKQGLASGTVAAEMDLGSVAFIKLAAGGSYYQGWHDGRWLVVVQTASPDLGDRIVDRLSEVLPGM